MGRVPARYYENKLGRSEILTTGKLVVAGQQELLAGSTQDTGACVANVMAFAGVSLKDAVDMASKNPAGLLGQEVVRLRRGSRADLVVFQVKDRSLQVETTIAGGELKYGQIVVR